MYSWYDDFEFVNRLYKQLVGSLSRILPEAFGVVLGVEVEDLPGAGGVVDFPGVVGGAVEDVEADVFGFDTGFNHASYVAVAEPAYEAAGV